jgi:hypothetical protein
MLQHQNGGPMNVVETERRRSQRRVLWSLSYRVKKYITRYKLQFPRMTPEFELDRLEISHCQGGDRNQRDRRSPVRWIHKRMNWTESERKIGIAAEQFAIMRCVPSIIERLQYPISGERITFLATIRYDDRMIDWNSDQQCPFCDWRCPVR